MAMSARQERWYREKDLVRLRQQIGEAPLTVHCRAREGGGTIYVVGDLHGVKFEGRFQVVAGWIDGFVAAWAWAKC